MARQVSVLLIMAVAVGAHPLLLQPPPTPPLQHVLALGGLSQIICDDNRIVTLQHNGASAAILVGVQHALCPAVVKLLVRLQQ